MIEVIENVFSIIAEYAALLAEIVGVLIVVISIVKAVIGLIKNENSVSLGLGKGIALALEFKMCGELLKTVVVREWSEILMLGAVIVLRAAMTFLIHWEIDKEEALEKLNK